MRRQAGSQPSSSESETRIGAGMCWYSPGRRKARTWDIVKYSVYSQPFVLRGCRYEIWLGTVGRLSIESSLDIY